MRHRHYKPITLLLAILLAASSWVSLPGRAEAQMRCAGVSPQSPPCARVELPAAGLTETRAYGLLMACCRSPRGGCATMRDCPMSRHGQKMKATRRSALSARCCLVSLRLFNTVPASLAAQPTRWLLDASPALAPPLASHAAAVLVSQNVQAPLWTDPPVLSPQLAPALHGLRAPPLA